MYSIWLSIDSVVFLIPLINILFYIREILYYSRCQQAYISRRLVNSFYCEQKERKREGEMIIIVRTIVNGQGIFLRLISKESTRSMRLNSLYGSIENQQRNRLFRPSSFLPRMTGWRCGYPRSKGICGRPLCRIWADTKASCFPVLTS